MKRNIICIVGSLALCSRCWSTYLHLNSVFYIAIWRFYTLIRWRWLKNKLKRPRKQFHVILSNILSEVYALITALIYALTGPINLEYYYILYNLYFRETLGHFTWVLQDIWSHIFILVWSDCFCLRSSSRWCRGKENTSVNLQFFN